MKFFIKTKKGASPFSLNIQGTVDLAYDPGLVAGGSKETIERAFIEQLLQGVAQRLPYTSTGVSMFDLELGVK